VTIFTYSIACRRTDPDRQLTLGHLSPAQFEEVTMTNKVNDERRKPPTVRKKPGELHIPPTGVGSLVDRSG
jgi:hypothetical protein